MSPITTVLGVWIGWNLSEVIKIFTGNYQEREEAAKSMVSTGMFAAVIIATLAFWASCDKKPVVSPESMTNSPTTQVESNERYGQDRNDSSINPLS